MVLSSQCEQAHHVAVFVFNGHGHFMTFEFFSKDKSYDHHAKRVIDSYDHVLMIVVRQSFVEKSVQYTKVGENWRVDDVSRTNSDSCKWLDKNANLLKIA